MKLSTRLLVKSRQPGLYRGGKNRSPPEKRICSKTVRCTIEKRRVICCPRYYGGYVEYLLQLGRNRRIIFFHCNTIANIAVETFYIYDINKCLHIRHV